MQAEWSKANAALPPDQQSPAPKVTVYNLPEVMLEMKDSKSHFFDNFGFFPSQRDLQVLKDARAAKNGRPRQFARFARY